MTKIAILSMGLPGAGKSYVLKNNFDTTGFIVIDPDAIKEEKADYNPKQPAVYHDWSKEQAKIRTQQAIENGQNLIIDGTGTNTPKMVKQIRELQSYGYEVTLLYVQVSLSTSLYRNAQRARTVSEEVIYQKYPLIDKSFEVLSDYADIAKKINND